MRMHPTGIYNVSYEQEIQIFRTRCHKLLLLASFLFIAIVPTLWFNNRILSFLIVTAITMIAMQGMNILFGYTGQISIGHTAFIAVGSYASAILSTKLGFPFLAAFICSGIASALAGLLFALPSLRVKGFYLAITTLGAYFIIIWIIHHGGGLTGEIYGLSLSYASIAGIVLNTDRKYYVFTVIMTFLLTLMAKNVVRSHVGRAFIAVRDNDISASVMGINVFKSKLLAFFIACFYAGLAGSMMSHYTLSVHPEQFTFMDSIWYLGFLAVGGMGSVMGSIFGVTVWCFLKEIVSAIVPMAQGLFPANISINIFSGLSLIIFGLVVVAFLVLEPRGINHRWNIFKSYYRLWPFSY